MENICITVSEEEYKFLRKYTISALGDICCALEKRASAIEECAKLFSSAEKDSNEAQMRDAAEELAELASEVQVLLEEKSTRRNVMTVLYNAHREARRQQH